MSLLKKLGFWGVLGSALVSGIANAEGVCVEPGLEIHKQTAHLVDYLGDGDGVAESEDLNKFNEKTMGRDTVWMQVKREPSEFTNELSTYIPILDIRSSRIESMRIEAKYPESKHKYFALGASERMFGNRDEMLKQARIIDNLLFDGNSINVIKLDIRGAKKNPRNPVVVDKFFVPIRDKDEDTFMDGSLEEVSLNYEKPIDALLCRVGNGRKEVYVFSDEKIVYAVAIPIVNDLKFIAKDKENLYVLGQESFEASWCFILHTFELESLIPTRVYESDIVRGDDRFRGMTTHEGAFYWDEKDVQSTLDIDFDGVNPRITLERLGTESDRKLKPLFIKSLYPKKPANTYFHWHR